MGLFLITTLNVSWWHHDNAQVIQCVVSGPEQERGTRITSLAPFLTISFTACLQGPSWPPGGSRGLSAAGLPFPAPPRSPLALSFFHFFGGCVPDLASPTRDRTRAPYSGSAENYWTTREVPPAPHWPFLIPNFSTLQNIPSQKGS